MKNLRGVTVNQFQLKQIYTVIAYPERPYARTLKNPIAHLYFF